MNMIPLFTESQNGIVDRIWQPRFYDFNVFSEQKQTEKINYMHNNPVKRGLVSSPAEWRSFPLIPPQQAKAACRGPRIENRDEWGTRPV